MGTDLGHGGFVRGKGIVCPYHEWSFDVNGKLLKMPFGGRATAECGIDSCNIPSYKVKEFRGMIFVWFHADGGEPFDTPVLDRLDELNMRFITRIVMPDFLMHVMEPSHNTADWYHFKTVHSSVGRHWRSDFAWARVDHELVAARAALYGSLDDDGTPITKDDLLIIDEKVRDIKLLGVIPAKWASKLSSSQVRFHGPMISIFLIQVPFLGDLQVVMLITPVEPFRTHVEYHVFAGQRWPWLAAWLLGHAITLTVEQDREVWERRTQPDPRNPVKGDYDYHQYDRWLSQFYTKSSTTWKTAYEDLTW
eukprot:TRINITY_DN8294_c0_g1_i1.p1 TRINITY_DN8294_c0_g1~~TRINITY_DN8294_c0_g1_i1.p1  ORF type:complete len:307 (+),score=52.22 TRINITY_DN8294_c0_g1_i1:481-1401(+)